MDRKSSPYRLRASQPAGKPERARDRSANVRKSVELESGMAGQSSGGLDIGNNIVDVMKERRALGGSEELFRALVTHSPMASWVVDVEGCYRFASPKYYKMFQVPVKDLVGKLISEIHPPELARRYLSSNRTAIEAGQPVESLQPGLLPDGSPGEYLVVKFPIRDGNGTPLLCGMALDVTERRQFMIRLRDANKRLETLAEEQAAHLRELAGELTHAEQSERDRLYELLHDEVQPLLVAARLSLSGLGTGSSPEDWVRVAVEARDHISQVIQVARTLSIQLSPPLIREHGLKPALESLRDWVKRNHGLEVELLVAPSGEPKDLALRLVCFNAVRELLMNVVKHASTARVMVTTRRIVGEALQISVADNGNGFDPALATSGSGLAGIRRRLGMFGGSLQIDSRLGQGTVATLLVPVRPIVPAEELPGSNKVKRGRRKHDAENPDRR